MKLETHIAKQIMLTDERRCALFASRLEMISALLKTTSLESEHSGVKTASGWMGARFASIASLINPAPLQFRQKTHDSHVALHGAVKATKLNAGDAVGHSCIMGNGSDGHGVVINDTTFGDNLEVRCGDSWLLAHIRFKNTMTRMYSFLLFPRKSLTARLLSGPGLVPSRPPPTSAPSSFVSVNRTAPTTH